ncbi:hypothetical protein RMN56_18065 [Micromonospora halotolerans]|uniref:Uncharacterized protein n=1 Tax=Micromonospora halotolerans TaxID=709879 RepID=A0ABY9ZPC7_9ACTN|nr:hypothetical protein [Micromonospora halotolerans]WNM37093.1 hypothetical protein RMN56_18065 [Micromonospora halotolerans]
MGDAERRRRRLRHHGDGGTPDAEGASASTAGVHDGDPRPQRGAPRPGPDPDDGSRAPRGARRAEPESDPRGRRPGPTGEEGERGLRGLVGSGSSQVSVTAALRARDAARPSDEDLAEAEARVVIVRRNWVPREELPRAGR